MLVCHTLQRQHDSIDAIARGARSGPLSRARLAEASARVEALQNRFARSATSIDPMAAGAACATEEHKHFSAQLSEAAEAATRPVDPTERRV